MAKKISPSARSLIVDYLKKKHTQPCSACGAKGFVLLETLYAVPTISNSNIDVGEVVPCAAVSCVNCGNMLFFPIKRIGLTLLDENNYAASGHENAEKHANATVGS